MLGSNLKQIEKCENMMKGFSREDKNNWEGLIAKLYLRELFGSGFIRFNNDTINANIKLRM